MYGICKICGCTDQNACVSFMGGPCYWLDDTHMLCSCCRSWKDTDISGNRRANHLVVLQGESYSDDCEVRLIIGWDTEKVYFVKSPSVGALLQELKPEECSREEFESWSQQARIYRGETSA